MGKQAVPEAHQAALANGCEGLPLSAVYCVVHHVDDARTYLQLGQVLWPLLDVHPPQADADGAGRDDDDLVAILSQLHGRLDDGRQDGEERLMALFVDDGARSWGLCQ